MSAPAAPRNSLQAVLDRQAVTPPDEVEEPVAPQKKMAAPRTEPKAEKFFRPSREGRKLIAGHFPPKTAKQLKILAAEEGTTVQALLEEALELLFVKKAKAAIRSELPV
jgi:hypothetical protein